MTESEVVQRGTTLRRSIVGNCGSIRSSTLSGLRLAKNKDSGCQACYPGLGCRGNCATQRVVQYAQYSWPKSNLPQVFRVISADVLVLRTSPVACLVTWSSTQLWKTFRMFKARKCGQVWN